VRLEFLVYLDVIDGREVKPETVRRDKAGRVKYEYVPVGSHLERSVTVEQAEGDPEGLKRRYEVVRAAFLEHQATYEAYGELLLRHEPGLVGEMREAVLSGKGHKCRPLVAAEWRARAGTHARMHHMCRVFQVSRSQMNREINAMVDEGWLSEDEVQRRRRRGPA
jgi:hypothetical protein